MARVAVIAGSGMDFIGPIDGWIDHGTPYGAATVGAARLGQADIVLLRRHGRNLNVPPHLINHRANMWALKDMGVTAILATSAVGSLHTDLPPGTLSLVDDFIDFTRRSCVTAFDTIGEEVSHIDFTASYSPEIAEAIRSAASALGIALGRDVVYVGVDGPRYETRSEIRMFALWGGDVIGMTGTPEAILANEMGIPYGALAIVTNYGCGISAGPLSHTEVLALVRSRREDLRLLLTRALEQLVRGA